MFSIRVRKSVWRLVLPVVVLALATLACGEDTPPAQQEPTQQEPTQVQPTVEIPAHTAEPSPTVEPTPEATPTFEPTGETSGCTPDAVFQADVTVPDDTRIEIGQRFVKTWRIRNAGTCDWGADYRFSFVEGDQMGGPAWVSVPETTAGETAEVSVELTAPMDAGQYRGNWQMCVGEARCFGSRLYVQIVAFDPSKAVATVPPASPLPPTAPAAQQPQPTAAPTEPLPPAAAVCDCSGDLYNCSNFSTHAQAQACYEYCMSLGRGDIHRLDRDNNGIVCESLP